MAISAVAVTATPLPAMVALPLTAVQLARTMVQGLVPPTVLDMAPAQATALVHLITVRALAAATAAAIAMPGIVVPTR